MTVTTLPKPAHAEGAYHVFVYHPDKPNGGMRDLVASVATLEDARAAAEQATGPGRLYFIVTVHPETYGLVIVENGSYAARKPSKINFDPWASRFGGSTH